MTNIIQQRPHKLLARPLQPLKQRQENTSFQTNIFASLRSTEPMPTLHKFRGKSFDFVGTHEFKQKYLQPLQQEQPKKHSSIRQFISSDLFADANKQYNLSNRNQNMSNSQVMNSTIHRNTILSKMSKDQTNLLTKQTRQLHRYREYQQHWDEESKRIRRKSLRKEKEKTLLEDEVKDIYIHPNKDRMDIINDHVIHMWEMSLRNNNKRLLSHIKGNKFKQVQLEQLLQSQNGVKKVEKTIPILPLQHLKGVKRRQLSLTGRNKSYSSTQKTGNITERLSINQSNNGEEVYKINYQGGNKWLSTDGL